MGGNTYDNQTMTFFVHAASTTLLFDLRKLDMTEPYVYSTQITFHMRENHLRSTLKPPSF